MRRRRCRTPVTRIHSRAEGLHHVRRVLTMDGGRAAIVVGSGEIMRRMVTSIMDSAAEAGLKLQWLNDRATARLAQTQAEVRFYLHHHAQAPRGQQFHLTWLHAVPTEGEIVAVLRWNTRLGESPLVIYD